MKKIILLLLCTLLLAVSARSQYHGQLVSDSLVMAMGIHEIKTIYNLFGLQESWVPIDFQEVEIHKIVYWTANGQYNGLTQASGLVTFPVNYTCDFPLLSYHHGTLMYDEELSAFQSKLNQHFIGVPMAANGYVTALPDYLGYGATPKEHPHPYLHAKSEGITVVDMLRATRDFCMMYDINLNDQLFLLGYSQGGHVTMAAHKELQEFHAEEFTVTASAPCSGPYDLSGILRDSMLWTDKFSNPTFISFITVAYDYIYDDVYDKLSDVFKAPYDNWIGRIFDRENPETNYLDSMPVPGIDMFKPEYLEAILEDSLHPINVHLRQNDLYDWAPLAPVNLFYCTEDEQVPYENALFTQAHMNALGAENVTSTFSGPYDHFGCTSFAVLGAKMWFENYRTACTVGVAEKSEQTQWIRFDPNPFQDRIVVESAELQPVTLSMHDLTGQEVWSSDVEGTREITLPDVPPGSYFILARTEGKQAFQKLVKQR